MQKRDAHPQTSETVVKQMAVAVTRCSRDFRYLWANQAYADWIGRPLNEIVHRPVSEVLGENAFEVLLPYFNRVLAGESVHYEQKTTFQGIGPRWISADYTPTFDATGNVDGWMAVMVDVTERRKSEQALRESEERLRLAAEAGRMFAYSWDPGTDVIERSGESAEILGLREGAAATGTAVAAMVHPADKQKFEAALSNLTVEKPNLRIAYRVVRPDGTVIWLERNSRAYFDEHGEIKRIVGMVVDITERKRAEAELRDSEERFRLAAQAGKMYAYDWNARTNEVVRSPEFVAVLGLREPEPLSDEEFVDGIHPEDRERFLNEIAALTPEKPNRDITYRFLCPRGKTIWLKSSGHALFDEAGKLQRVIGMVTDVTELKLTEDKLREYEKAVEGAEDIIGVVDREYRLLLVNHQYLKIRNLTREQVVGHFVTEVLGKETFETVIRPKLDECFQGKVVRYEMKFSYPTVGERDLLLSYFPIEGGNGVDRVACILHDITDRKRAEEALLEMNRMLETQGSLLRSREELLRVFVKSVPAAVAMLDRDMHYLQASDRWCSDYLPGRAEIIGRSHYESFPDMPERWKEIHRRALQGEILRADEDRWDGQDGTHWARWEVRPWMTAEGAVGGILIFAEDITRIKQSEETLSKVNQKLIQAHEAERTRIARELHDDICQRIALLALRLDDFRRGNPELQTQLRRQLGQASEEAQELGSDVQALSHRLHSSKLQHLGLAAAAAGFCREFSDQSGVEIDFQSGDIPTELPEDISICIFRVLQEAVQNAARHSGTRHFRVSLRNGSSEIELTVQDSGIGFDPEMALRKNGLGLTSMRERMKLVQGELSIESEIHRGTTVCARVSYNPAMK